MKAIRADPAFASLHVIAVTADTEFQGKVADLGFDGMLLKPVTMEKLAGVLRGVGVDAPRGYDTNR